MYVCMFASIRQLNALTKLTLSHSYSKNTDTKR